MASLLFIGGNRSVSTEDVLEAASELRVTAVHDPPYVSVHTLPNGSYKFDGYLYDIWKIIAQTLNIRYRLTPVSDGGFGLLDGNGTWNGMVGDLAYGRADVGLTWFLDEERSFRSDRLPKSARRDKR